ncbi:uncharacterized protein LOC134778743 [Penaeus indicus]|uniref:uncharacterized protein LOC134778743 n=1 Tax=Penaeus indicus TaxID=29960 RepID=UPI00300C7E15
MFPLALLAFCCVTSWTEATPPSVGQTESDLRTSVVFNQLALAEVLESLRNMSHGDLASATHLEQLARRQEGQLQDLARGLADVNSSVGILSQSLTSHIQQDIFLERELRLCGNLTEVLQRRVASQEDEIRERQDANTALKAKHRDLQQELITAGGRSQELQQRRFGLQAEDAQLKYEEAEVKIENLEAKTALRRLQQEKTQLETELRVLEQGQSESHAAQDLEAQLSKLRRRITEVTGATVSLAHTKGTLAEQKTALSRDADETEAQNEQLKQENERLEQENAEVQSSVQDLKTAAARMGQDISSLTNRKSDLQRRYNLAVGSKNEALKKIGTLNAQIKDLTQRINFIAC